MTFETRPTPQGEYASALFAAMLAKPARVRVDEKMLELAAAMVDPDLRAFFWALAHHRAESLDVGDWEFDRSVGPTCEPHHVADARRAIKIGQTAGGDMFVCRLYEDRASVYWVSEHGPEEKLEGDFEDLLWNVVTARHEDGEPSDLDAFIER